MTSAVQAPRIRLVTALVANLLVVCTAAIAMVLHSRDPDLYYRSVQEDEWVEWVTFWAFAAAAAMQAALALERRRGGARLVWFPLGLSLFCLVVAMEEVSWGQRVIGYRPPVYFLEHNFQQELNLHNVVDEDHRKLALEVVILGYGVALPLLAFLPGSRRIAQHAGVTAPTAALVPAFFATFFLYQRYPWDFSGEWVELMLGLGFLVAATLASRPSSRLLSLLLASAVVVGLGTASAAATRLQRTAHPQLAAAALAEVEALRRDFEGRNARARCDIHKRLYGFVKAYRQQSLLRGEFAALTAQGLTEERARYFLDPWNSPYWIRRVCGKDGSSTTFVYSFGPNRRRESSRRALGGDDVGAYIDFEAPRRPKK